MDTGENVKPDEDGDGPPGDNAGSESDYVVDDVAVFTMIVNPKSPPEFCVVFPSGENISLAINFATAISALVEGDMHKEVAQSIMKAFGNPSYASIVYQRISHLNHQKKMKSIVVPPRKAFSVDIND
jgi:hypothetical protein